jgi:hypothetical protein
MIYLKGFGKKNLLGIIEEMSRNLPEGTEETYEELLSK